ncbi:hypothetical protein ACFOPX_01625 [Helicobacter baculiformis]|uniref:Uncharacterized protein n=1 Tax=Helicobacter baculiformis TaxID=427351 RepID=A0ABV7ZGF3_9HELI|nr:hypothetical protein [Helicobacter baculiformis]
MHALKVFLSFLCFFLILCSWWAFWFRNDPHSPSYKAWQESLQDLDPTYAPTGARSRKEERYF